jgi:hypothetical protein
LTNDIANSDQRKSKTIKSTLAAIKLLAENDILTVIEEKADKQMPASLLKIEKVVWQTPIVF